MTSHSYPLLYHQIHISSKLQSATKQRCSNSQCRNNNNNKKLEFNIQIQTKLSEKERKKVKIVISKIN